MINKITGIKMDKFGCAGHEGENALKGLEDPSGIAVCGKYLLRSRSIRQRSAAAMICVSG